MQTRVELRPRDGDFCLETRALEQSRLAHQFYKMTTACLRIQEQGELEMTQSNAASGEAYY
jgi:hypothetical protein